MDARVLNKSEFYKSEPVTVMKMRNEKSTERNGSQANGSYGPGVDSIS